MQFPSLPYLKTLDFSHCLISHIDRKAFSSLSSSVEAIVLKGNRLCSLQKDIFLTTTNIKSLELHQNPWKCDCHLKQFRDWVVEKGLYNYPTTCKDPERLSGKMWETVQSVEFACKPQLEVAQKRVYSKQGDNVTLSCFITGNPVPEAKWVLRGRIVTNNTNSLYGTNKNIQYVIHEKGGFERWFNLTVVNISEEDEDDYTCVGVNAGGVSEQNVSLTFDQPKISPDTHEPVGLTRGVLVAMASALSLSLFSCTFFCCCRRKSLKRSGEQDSYNGSIVGITSSDQQSLIQPKSILKYGDNSRQAKPQDSSDTENRHCSISEATVHLYDAVQYPHLQTTNTGQGQASNTSFSHKTVDVSTIRLEEARDGAASHLIFTYSNSSPPASNSLVATAAILPPPPSFLCQDPPDHVQTVAISKVPSSTSSFLTLPRTRRRTTSSPCQEAEVNLAPFFDGMGPRTCSDFFQDPRSDGEELEESLPPPPMFCTICEVDPDHKGNKTQPINY